jgi:hypothetical protein
MCWSRTLGRPWLTVSVRSSSLHLARLWPVVVVACHWVTPGWNKAGHPLPCGKSSATLLTCVFASQRFSSYPASSRDDVPSLCPRWRHPSTIMTTCLKLCSPCPSWARLAGGFEPRRCPAPAPGRVRCARVWLTPRRPGQERAGTAAGSAHRARSA